jgi:hypothetical protein
VRGGSMERGDMQGEKGWERGKRGGEGEGGGRGEGGGSGRANFKKPHGPVSTRLMRRKAAETQGLRVPSATAARPDRSVASPPPPSTEDSESESESKSEVSEEVSRP